MRRDISLEGFGGTVLRGWYYTPEGAGAAPAIVMAHGFSAVKEMALDPFARAFCDAGMAVLVYDHRNLGASDGTPRQEINLWAQARDYRHAISWLARQPEVCADRIAIWGSSFSGGEVIVVGACDRRVKAVIANVPFACLPGVDYENAPDTFPAIRQNLLDEGGGGLADLPGEVMGPLAVVKEEGNELPVFLNNEAAAAWFLAFGRLQGSRWENRVTIRNSFGTDPAFDPGISVRHVSPTPLLMVVATHDELADTAGTLATFARAGEPKHLTTIEGGHFVAYQGRGFELAVNAMREFLLANL
jgi:uncharacterized protein